MAIAATETGPENAAAERQRRPAIVAVDDEPAVLAAVAGVLQATSLPFIVAATAIGMEIGALGTAEGSALIAAGLLSVLIFPVTGLTLLRRAVAEDGRGISSDAWQSAPISTRSASIPPTP